MTAIPADAERFDLLDYLKDERMPSRLCPGLQQIKPVLICPGCQRKSPPPTSTTPFACDCGLTMQIRNLSLYVWKETVPA